MPDYHHLYGASRDRSGLLAPPRAPSLWVIEWHNRRLTVLTARNEADARQRAGNRQRCDEDGWQDLDIAQICRILPVNSLQLEVSSRAQANRPKFGFLWVGRTVIDWSGPHDGSTPSRKQRADLGVLSGQARTSRYPARRLWSYVWSDRELLLLSAADFESACLGAANSRFGHGRVSVDHLVEPIMKFELQLAEGASGHAPICYRLWIDGYKVGWPPTEDQEPRRHNPPPETPLPAEALLPIPRYAFTYAYGPRTDRSRDPSVG